MKCLMEKQAFTDKLTSYYIKHLNILNPAINLEKVIESGRESETFVYSLTYVPKLDRNVVKRALRLLTGVDFATAEAEYKTPGINP